MKPHKGKFKKYLTKSKKEQVEIGCLIIKEDGKEIELDKTCKGTYDTCPIGKVWDAFDQDRWDCIKGTFHTHIHRPEKFAGYGATSPRHKMSALDVEFDMELSDYSCLGYNNKVLCHDYRGLDKDTRLRYTEMAQKATKALEGGSKVEYDWYMGEIESELKARKAICRFTI